MGGLCLDPLMGGGRLFPDLGHLPYSIRPPSGLRAGRELSYWWEFRPKRYGCKKKKKQKKKVGN